MTIEVPVHGAFRPTPTMCVDVIVFAHNSAGRNHKPIIDRLQEAGLGDAVQFQPARITQGGMK